MTADFDMVGAIRLEPPAGDEPGVGRRKAFRAIPPGVTARVQGTLDSFGVNDISAGGVCMMMPEILYEKGKTLRLDLLIAGRLFLHDLEALVVRAVPGECACAFQNLSRRQELKLDKLVLEIQKREIIRRRLEREAEKVPPAARPAPAGTDGAEGDEAAGRTPGEDPPPTINLPL